MMRITALALCGLSVLSLPAAAQTLPPVWTQVEALYVNTGPPRQWQGPVRATNCDGSPCQNAGPASDTWALVDLTVAPWGIPANAVAVDMRGLLIITHGNAVETADLEVVFRAPGDTRVACTLDHLIGQAVEASNGNGIRSGLATWTPVIGGKIEWCWHRSTSGTYPANSAYAVNLSIQAVAVGAPLSAIAKSPAPAPILGLMAPNKAVTKKRANTAVKGWCLGDLCWK